MLVFGGFGAEGRVADLWSWDGAAWSRLDAVGPPARAEHEGVYVPGGGFVVFGGVVGQSMAVAERTRANDLWIYDGAAWRRGTP